MVLERWTNPKLSRRTCTCEYGHHRVEGNRRASRNALVSALPPEARVRFTKTCAFAVADRCCPLLSLSAPLLAARPQGRQRTGTPASLSERARSVSAMVLDDLSAATRGLRVWSTPPVPRPHPPPAGSVEAWRQFVVALAHNALSSNISSGSSPHSSPHSSSCRALSVQAGMATS
jgi:hypothetical protein